jgi:uncharacterized protein
MTDYIGYEALTQAAMRGVVREALKRAKTNGGLPGDHHFYITYSSRAPGVRMADYLVERFPVDMTIVVQHQFWDLEVHDGHFEIILKFSGVPQHLFIPYAAITRFVDPSVNFGLTFEAKDKDAAVIAPATEINDADTEVATPASEAGTVVNLDAFRRK